MEQKVIKIRKRAEKILMEENITILANEKKLLKELEKISKTNGENLELETMILDKIESYILAKEKNYFAEKDLEFLCNLAKELKEQKVRKSDINNPPLFKIVDSNGEDRYFLTRKALEKYKEYHNVQYKGIIEIPYANSEELTELLEIIKRNF